MDAFDLDETVIERYKAFARSFTNIRSPELHRRAGAALAGDDPQRHEVSIEAVRLGEPSSRRMPSSAFA